MITVLRYTDAHKERWDAFVRSAKNNVFFFQRDFMDYHADRFHDHSLLFMQDNSLLAVLPANELKDRLVSHGGLTFGGFVVDAGMTTRRLLEAFAELIVYLRGHGFKMLDYKCIPHIYHTLPAEEDRYALFIHGATLWRRDMTATVQLQGRPPFQERRRRGARKAQEAGVELRVTDQFAAFWDILADNLQRVHQTRPVHSLAEIELLHRRFPDHVRLFGAYRDSRLLAGVVIFENPTVAHAQYISASEEGKRTGALDLLFAWLIQECFSEKKYFDFGISTENDGRVLNEGLIDQKEGFGARGVVHDHYRLEIGPSGLRP